MISKHRGERSWPCTYIFQGLLELGGFGTRVLLPLLQIDLLLLIHSKVLRGFNSSRFHFLVGLDALFVIFFKKLAMSNIVLVAFCLFGKLGLEVFLYTKTQPPHSNNIIGNLR